MYKYHFLLFKIIKCVLFSIKLYNAYTTVQLPWMINFGEEQRLNELEIIWCIHCIHRFHNEQQRAETPLKLCERERKKSVDIFNKEEEIFCGSKVMELITLIL